jgi:two-component system CitB family sensor kinase
VWRLSTRRLSTQIFIAQLAILTATVFIGFVLFARVERAQLDRQYEQRAGAIAQTVAGVPDIQACMHGIRDRCREPIQSVATRIQHETGASYVVVIDMNRVRHSHPIGSLIGQKVEEPILTADGRTHVGIDNGATGRSANGRAPMYAADGQTMIGEVSVGIKESSVSKALWHELPTYAGCVLAAGPPAQAQDVRARTRRDRPAAPGTRGDVARHPRGGDRIRPGRADLGRQRRGTAASRRRGRPDRLSAGGPAAARPAT